VPPSRSIQVGLPVQRWGAPGPSPLRELRLFVLVHRTGRPSILRRTLHSPCSMFGRERGSSSRPGCFFFLKDSLDLDMAGCRSGVRAGRTAGRPVTSRSGLHRRRLDRGGPPARAEPSERRRTADGRRALKGGRRGRDGPTRPRVAANRCMGRLPLYTSRDPPTLSVSWARLPMTRNRTEVRRALEAAVALGLRESSDRVLGAAVACFSSFDAVVGGASLGDVTSYNVVVAWGGRRVCPRLMRRPAAYARRRGRGICPSPEASAGCGRRVIAARADRVSRCVSGPRRRALGRGGSLRLGFAFERACGGGGRGRGRR